MSLAELLVTARVKRGWSLDRASAELGITKAHLWDLEKRNSFNPTLSVVRMIVRTYKISPRAIVEST